IYVVLKDWAIRGKAKGQDLLSIYKHLSAELDKLPDAIGFVIVPPPIQGIGNASGFTMQVQLRDGSNDFTKLERVTRAVVSNASSQTGLQRVITPFRAEVPQLNVVVNRVAAESRGVAVGDVFSVLSSYVGSTFINQFNKFGRTFQVYAQAEARFRLQPRDIDRLYVRNQSGSMVPLGALVQVTPDVGPALISLYNLYPSASVVGAPAQGFSSGEAISLMEQIAQQDLPPGIGYEWTALSYQEKAVGGQIYLVFGLGLVLVYLCLAGQYESWIAPLSVILAVPLALAGPALALTSVGLPNNLYTQIGLVLLIALAAKNAILIVEVAREQRLLHNLPIVQAAVHGARTRFRPIIMTSFAFILGVSPLVSASGAGAAARISLGLSVMSGMIASTCLAVLFVPSFFVVLQVIEERVKTKRQPQPARGTV
ncbi:MAG: efflux RND transporter permease subunit, partial [Acetobacteraceae bacterium]|nr:efflux RND transporter permease subunit [Acetobacteraceae bacterium]